MPLPTDEKLIATTNETLSQFKTAFGSHAGFRPAHAKGAVVTGSFEPSGAASKYTIAKHLTSTTPTPVTARFSSSTALPQIPDTNPNANPRGFALRFNLPSVDGRRVHTDIITHSTPFFPTRTGEEFQEVLKAIIASPEGTPSPTPLEQFLGTHPAALAHVTAPKPFPVSLATQKYYGVNAFKFENADGAVTFIRYQIHPVAEVATLTDAEVEGKSADYLFSELPQRLASGPAIFKLMAQIAEEGDVTDDATVHWPESRQLVELGTITLDAFKEDSATEQKNIIFDPIPRVPGIEPSDDPLLEFRAALYLISGKERRAA